MKRRHGLILILLLLGFGLRVWNLAGQSFWWDEAFTWQTTSHGPANLWQMLLTGDRNPPLYFVSVAAWGSVAGWSEFSLRFVSVCWMLLGLAFLYNLAKRAYSTSAGLWTLVLAVVAPALVVYAQEARMYAAFFALTAATLYFAWRVYERSTQHSTFSAQQSAVSGQKEVGAFLVCEAGLLLTHYFALPLVVALNLFALIVLARRRARFTTCAKWIGGQLLAALPIVIWTLIVFATPGSLINAQETPPGAFSFMSQVAVLWLSGVRDLQGNGWGLLALALPLLAVALIDAGRRNVRNTVALGLFGLMIWMLAYVMANVLTSFHPRYLLPYSIPWFVLLGGALDGIADDFKCVWEAYERRSATLGLRRAKQRPIKTGSDASDKWISAVGGLLVSAFVFVLSITLLRDGWQVVLMPEYSKDDVRSVAAYLQQHAMPADVILLEANDYTLNYYAHGLAQTKMITATTEPEALMQLSASLGSAQRVWLPHWTVSTQDPRSYWHFLFEQSGRLKDWIPYHGYELYQYDLQASLHEPVVDQDIALSQGPIEFAKWTGVAGQEGEGALAFAIKWQLPDSIEHGSAISMRLQDKAGMSIAGVDVPLRSDTGKSVPSTNTVQTVLNYYVLPIPPGTPPLTYTLVALAYDAPGQMAGGEYDVYRIERPIASIQLTRRLETSDPYRTLAGYDWQVPPNAPIRPGLMLEAYALSSQKPGGPMPLDITLRWRKTDEVSNFKPRLRLVQTSRVWGEIGSILFEHDYPIGQWVAGETVIDRLKIDYPPVRGPIDLQIGQGDQWTTLTTLQIDESQLLFTPPSMQHAQSAQFGAFAELLGYDLKSDSLSAARPLNLTLYWRATNTEPITTPYTVFTQILAPDGHLVAQDDAPPRPPTLQWVSGQIVRDDHTIKLVDPAYRGPATLIVGWYNSATIERVPVSSGGDHVTLQTPVRVEDQ